VSTCAEGESHIWPHFLVSQWSVIQNRSASPGLLGPGELPVPVRYGENHSMTLNNTTIKEVTV
jgi:hypothetical protein